MGSQDSAMVARRWPAVGLLVLTSLWCSIRTARGEAADGGAGDGGAAEGGARGGRLLLSFQEAKGNASFRCSPSGLCLPCQYSEKVPLRFLPPITTYTPHLIDRFLTCQADY
ncbi:hypothetical protein BHE74_00015377 [Ensete ventricosum]|nr:hypothetical protein GW17_00018082 [Ensete ventricosum]RWW76519.1 hypothetical protein BHE74_00015377 [Ensete ventricosum]RZR94700.1 hypothetical protein BHM03_00023459 [Ensete ventricosum]